MGEVIIVIDKQWQETRRRARLASNISIPAAYADALTALIAHVLEDVYVISGNTYPSAAQPARLATRERLKGCESRAWGCIASQQDALDATRMLMSAIANMPGLLFEHTHPSARALIKKGINELTKACRAIWGDEDYYKCELDKIREALARLPDPPGSQIESHARVHLTPG